MMRFSIFLCAKIAFFFLFWGDSLTPIFAFQDGAQGGKYFEIPKGFSAADHIPGVLLVKIKPGYKKVFETGLQNAPSLEQSLKTAGFENCFPMFPEAARQKPGYKTDLGLYYQLAFKNMELEKTMKAVFALGFADLIEPALIDQTLLAKPTGEAEEDYHLKLIKIKEAWQISVGDTVVMVANIDSEYDKTHHDLYMCLREMPIPDYKTGRTQSVASNSLQSATGNIGVMNAAFGNTLLESGKEGLCKVLPSDHSGNDYVDAGLNQKLYFTLKGVVWAAFQGAEIINCPFGNPWKSLIAEEIYAFVSEEMNVLVVAGAGNKNSKMPLYPAAFENVLAVAATDEQDKKTDFSNYGNHIAVCAPGQNLITCDFGESHTSISGTGVAGSVVAGASAILKSVYQGFSGKQIGELLRVTADDISDNNNSQFDHSLGKGRINLHRALNEIPPSVRVKKPVLTSDKGSVIVAGDTANLEMAFINYLWPTTHALKAELISLSPYVKVLDGTFEAGKIAMSKTIDNRSRPFVIYIKENIPDNSMVEFRVEFKDKNYDDCQHFVIPINHTLVNLQQNRLSVTIGSNGRIGFEEPDGQSGAGIQYKGRQLLNEMGLVLGSSEYSVSNNVRAGLGQTDDDFEIDKKAIYEIPGKYAPVEVVGKFNDNPAKTSKSFMDVSYRAMVWHEAPLDGCMLLEYDFFNKGDYKLIDFYAGLFADWDLNSQPTDKADWLEGLKMGYVYSADMNTGDSVYAGIQLLEGNPNYLALENLGANGPVLLKDGFSDAEKYTGISRGIKNTKAGEAGPGTDVSQLFGAGPFEVGPKSSVKAVFAIHAADSFEQLKKSAQAAMFHYQKVLKTPPPKAVDQEICFAQSAVLSAAGAKKIRWYAQRAGGNPIFEGSQFKTSMLLRDTAFYVANADNEWESDRARVSVKVKAVPEIKAEPRAFCQGDTITLTVAQADNYLWSNGATTRSIKVWAGGEYSVTLNDMAKGCISNSNTVSISVMQRPKAFFKTDKDTVYLSSNEKIIFHDQSEGAHDWLWDFGDGSFSSDQNPSHLFMEEGNFTVKLQATSSQGCQSVYEKHIIVIGEEDHSLGNVVSIFPNPTTGVFSVNIASGDHDTYKVSVYSSSGKHILSKRFKKHKSVHQEVIDIKEEENGRYSVRVSRGNSVTIKKLMKF